MSADAPAGGCPQPAPPKSLPPFPQPADFRWIPACVLLLICAALATWPVLDSPINDEVAYVRIARDFAATGRFVYTGWSEPILVPQVLWAALFIKLFGFSFLVVRLSVLVLAVLLVPVLYALARESGLRPSFAAFASLLTVLSPLTIEESVSFMTDVPSLFLFALFLYGAVRAWKARSSDSCLRWTVMAAIAGFVAGLDRQLYWLGPLSCLPIVAWVQRRQKSAVPGLAAAWMSIAVGVILSVRWFNTQPFAVHEDRLRGFHILGAADMLHREMGLMGLILFTFLFIILPVLAGFVRPALCDFPRNLLPLFGLLVLILCIAGLRSPVLNGPFMGPTLFWYAPAPSGGPAFGSGPLLMVPAVRIPLSACVVLFALACAFALWSRRRLLSLSSTSAGPLAWFAFIFGAGAIAAVLLRGAGGTTFDRYLVPLIPLAAVPLLWLLQEYVRPSLGALSWLLLAALISYGVALAHDSFAGNRASLQVARELQRAGIPRTAISANWEYDVSTQLEAAGHANNRWILTPHNAYKPPVCSGPEEFRNWYYIYTPALQPRFVVSLVPIPGWSTGPAAPVSYYTWLPPGRRRLIALHVPDNLTIGCR